MKSATFGKKFIHLNIGLNIIHTLLWTSVAAVRLSDIADKDSFRPSHGDMNFVMALTIISQLLTFFFIYKIYREWVARRQYVEDEKKIIEMQHERNKNFCHPRWVGDKAMLSKKLEAAQTLCEDFWDNGWVLLDAFTLLLACIYTVITLLYCISENAEKHLFPHNVRVYYSAFFVLFVWLRLNRCFKTHKSFGAFVDMLGECIVASCQIGFLFFECFIPFCVTFWVIFGGVKDGNSYYYLNDLVYQLYLLAIVGDYDFDSLVEIDSVSSCVLVSLYLVSISIITINLYIALLSEAFSRVIENAAYRSDLEKALFFADIERIFPETNREFEKYVNKCCAPLVMEEKEFSGGTRDGNMRAVVSSAAKTVYSLNSAVNKIVQTELLLKKDVNIMEEKFRKFHEQYPEERIKDLMKEFTDVVEYQSKPYVRVAKKTNDGIRKYIRQIRQGGKYLE